jgi:hypothetical protein
LCFPTLLACHYRDYGICDQPSGVGVKELVNVFPRQIGIVGDERDLLRSPGGSAASADML